MLHCQILAVAGAGVGLTWVRWIAPQGNSAFLAAPHKHEGSIPCALAYGVAEAIWSARGGGERLLLGAWITLGARIGDTTGTGDMERLGNGEGDLPCVVGKRQICSELCMISLGETSHLLQHLDPNMFRVKLMMHGRFNLIFGDVNETILIVIPAGYRQ